MFSYWMSFYTKFISCILWKILIRLHSDFCADLIPFLSSSLLEQLFCNLKYTTFFVAFDWSVAIRRHGGGDLYMFWTPSLWRRIIWKMAKNILPIWNDEKYENNLRRVFKVKSQVQNCTTNFWEIAMETFWYFEFLTCINLKISQVLFYQAWKSFSEIWTRKKLFEVQQKYRNFSV